MFRWSRLSRPLIVIYRVVRLRSTVIFIGKSIVHAKEIIILFFYVVIIGDVVVMTFGNEYLDQKDGDFLVTTVNTFFPGFVQMFILNTTGDNYSTFVDSTVAVSRWYMLFWVCITIAGMLEKLIMSCFSVLYFIDLLMSRDTRFLKLYFL